MGPLKLAIYYGYPSLVNNSVDVEYAIKTFLKYDIIIFRDLTDPLISDIINQLAKKDIKIFGYVDMISTQDTIKEQINIWRQMDVYGIYMDNCGYDHHISRKKQNKILDYVHNLNLMAFFNVKNPKDIFSNKFNVRYNPFMKHAHIMIGDWYLFENFQIEDIAKCKLLQKYRKKYNISVACIINADVDKKINQSKINHSYISSRSFNFDAWGYAEYMYSRDSDVLYFSHHTRNSARSLSIL